MVEKEALKEKEAEPVVPIDPHGDDPIYNAQRYREQSLKGKKLIRAKDTPFTMSKNGIRRVYARDWVEGLTNSNWNIFVHDIRTHSGKHVHQGGLILFVIKGKGYTVVDGRRFDWSEGDMICLPIKKGGVEHQHFNLMDVPSRWCAFIHYCNHHLLGPIHEQRELLPFWVDTGKGKK